MSTEQRGVVEKLAHRLVSGFLDAVDSGLKRIAPTGAMILIFASASLMSCGQRPSGVTASAEQYPDPDFSAALTTAAGLRQGDEVLFLDTPVGHVESVKPHNTGLIVGIKLTKGFRGHMHRGAKARAIRDERSGSTRLWIVGGNDDAARPLQESDTIPEANLIEALAENCSPGATTRMATNVRETMIGVLDAAARGIEKLKEHMTDNNDSAAKSSPIPADQP